jgi:hypothetical protein
MARPRRTTTQRGLGHTHQRDRAAQLPKHIGTRCPCTAKTCRHHPGKPCHAVLDSTAEWDHSTPRALGGTHADRFLCPPCNRSLGAVLGNQLRRHRTHTATTTTRTTTSRTW